MGYCCNIKTNKNIQEKDIQEIVDNLPDKYKGIIPYTTKQEWGWPCVCDIKLPDKNILTISGSYSISGMYAEEFVNYITVRLKSKNYITKVKWED